MGTRGLERFKQDCDALQLFQLGLEQSASPESRLTGILVKAMVENYRQIVARAEGGKPFIATSFGNAPELFVALDLPWYPLSLMPAYVGTIHPGRNR